MDDCKPLYRDCYQTNCRNLSSWDDYQQLVIARMQVDERKGERRCQQCSNQSGCHTERRTQPIDADGIMIVWSVNICLVAAFIGRAIPLHEEQRTSLLLTLLLATIVFAWLVPTQR